MATDGVAHRFSVDPVGPSSRFNAHGRVEAFGARSTSHSENTPAYTGAGLAEHRLKMSHATQAGAVLITASGLLGEKPLVRRQRGQGKSANRLCNFGIKSGSESPCWKQCIATSPKCWRGAICQASGVRALY